MFLPPYFSQKTPTHPLGPGSHLIWEVFPNSPLLPSRSHPSVPPSAPQPPVTIHSIETSFNKYSLTTYYALALLTASTTHSVCFWKFLKGKNALPRSSPVLFPNYVSKAQTISPISQIQKSGIPWQAMGMGKKSKGFLKCKLHMATPDCQ